MTTAITPLSITEAYQSLTVLTFDQLHQAIVTDIEGYVNSNVILNIVQMAVDVFGDTYAFNNDGVQTRTNPLVDDYTQKAADEVITGSWTFSDAVLFSSTVTSSSYFSSTGQQKCRIYISAANQSIDTADVTALVFDAESYDTGGLHSVGTTPSRIVCTSGASGVYILNAQVTFDNSNVGRREAYFYKNGSKIAETKCFNPDNTEQTVLNLTCQEMLTENDYIEVKVYHTKGSALNVLKGERVTFVTALKAW